MNPENSIEVRHVTKSFKIYKDKGTMLRERLTHPSRNQFTRKVVLNDISFEVKKGEAIALIGKNGCGKSTTLKMLTRIMQPNQGQIETRGKVYSMIELGAGFHPDMTGRENVYINASIFGIKKKEVKARMEEIIRFSELEKYIDSPVRTYSSGMYLRLAFSVAINVGADILLVDEILAVGDQNFQQKCLTKMKELKDRGVTIVLVSHSMDQVKDFCTRAIWIENGEIKEDGPSRKVCDDYKAGSAVEAKKRKLQEMGELDDEKSNEFREITEIIPQCSPDAEHGGTGEAFFTDIRLYDEKKSENTHFKMMDGMRVSLAFQSKAPVRMEVTIDVIRDDWAYCYGVSTYRYNQQYIEATEDRKKFDVDFHIRQLHLLPGTYHLNIYLKDEFDVPLDYYNQCIVFTVSEAEKQTDEIGFMTMEHDWSCAAR